jgi:FtsH-binding integral membrane protein
MSSQSHRERYFTKLLIAFASIISSVLIIFYCIFEKAKDSGWYFWAVVTAFLLCSGIFFGLQAFIHKMKSDLNQRYKQREQQKTFTPDN